MPESVQKPTQPKVSFIYWFVHTTVYFYTKLICRLKQRGLENLPAFGGVIVAANHVAGGDPFYLGSALPRETAFMAKRELFKPIVLRNLISRLNAFPVNRSALDLDAIKTAMAELAKGRVLLMFPEGTRSKDGRLKEGKLGVSMLARKAIVPIVPVYLANTKAAWKNLFHGKRLTINYGKPIDAEWIAAQEDSKVGYKIITDELMSRIKELSESLGD
jgi:1-acyl-sn-glycerol-3-phosphate acyltransferase